MSHLLGGEEDEKQRLTTGFEDVLHVMWRIVNASMRLTWVTAGYGWLTIVAPILVAAPGYFGGDLSFGGLMMIVGAFIQVQQSLRWFIDNFAIIAQSPPADVPLRPTRSNLLCFSISLSTSVNTPAPKAACIPPP